MKKMLLARLAAGLFVIGVSGLFTKAMAVPTFTFSPLEGGNKTLLTLSGQTQDRSDTVPDRLYYQLYDEHIDEYLTTEPLRWTDNDGHHIRHLDFRFTEGLEGLTVTSTMTWAPRIDLYPGLGEIPEPEGYPITTTISPITLLFLGDHDASFQRDEFVFQFTHPAGLDNPYLLSETLTFSGSAVLDLDFSQLNAGTYRCSYLGQPLGDSPPFFRPSLTHPTFEIVVVPEPATMSLLALGLGALAIRRRRRS